MNAKLNILAVVLMAGLAVPAQAATTAEQIRAQARVALDNVQAEIAAPTPLPAPAASDSSAVPVAESIRRQGESAVDAATAKIVASLQRQATQAIAAHGVDFPLWVVSGNYALAHPGAE